MCLMAVVLKFLVMTLVVEWLRLTKRLRTVLSMLHGGSELRLARLGCSLVDGVCWTIVLGTIGETWP